MLLNPEIASADGATVISPEGWERFVRENRMVPLALITICNIGNFERAIRQELRLPKPGRRYREWQTHKQLQRLQAQGAPEEALPRPRLSVGGKEIIDQGVSVMSGCLSIKTLKQAIPHMDSALFYQMNEGESQIKEKIEVRFRAHYPDGQDGLCQIDDFRETILGLDDNLRVGFHLWVNPTPEGWFRFNLVLNNWNQQRLANQIVTELEAFELRGIPTLDIESHGFTFA